MAMMGLTTLIPDSAGEPKVGGAAVGGDGADPVDGPVAAVGIGGHEASTAVVVGRGGVVSRWCRAACGRHRRRGRCRGGDRSPWPEAARPSPSVAASTAKPAAKSARRRGVLRGPRVSELPDRAHRSLQPDQRGRWENSYVKIATSATRLTRRVPWFCVPFSRRVCLFRLLSVDGRLLIRLRERRCFTLGNSSQGGPFAGGPTNWQPARNPRQPFRRNWLATKVLQRVGRACRATCASYDGWRRAADRHRCHLVAVVTAGPVSRGDLRDRHPRPGEHMIDPDQGGTGPSFCDHVMANACPLAAAPSVRPVSRIERKPLLFHVALKSPTTRSLDTSRGPPPVWR